MPRGRDSNNPGSLKGWTKDVDFRKIARRSMRVSQADRTTLPKAPPGFYSDKSEAEFGVRSPGSHRASAIEPSDVSL